MSISIRFLHKNFKYFFSSILSGKNFRHFQYEYFDVLFWRFWIWVFLSRVFWGNNFRYSEVFGTTTMLLYLGDIKDFEYFEVIILNFQMELLRVFWDIHLKYFEVLISSILRLHYYDFDDFTTLFWYFWGF